MSFYNEHGEEGALFRRYFRKRNYIKLGDWMLREVEKKAAKVTLVFNLVDQAEQMVVP